MKKQLAQLLTIITFFGLTVSLVQAQTTPPTVEINEASLTAIPPRLGEDLSLRAKPGETIQTSVRVRNSTSHPLNISSLAHDFIVADNGSTPIPLTEEVSNRWSLASWLILSPGVQEIAAGEIANINVVIDVPGDALPGGHYAMVTHQPSSDLINQGLGLTSATGLNQRVGTLLYLTVEGPINEAAFIRNLKFPRFSEFGPVPFSFTVDNQSDIHIRPQIGIEIYNIFGRKIETIELETKNVFPFITRDFEGEWNRVWGFGPYKAKAVMSYGSSGQIAVATASFWLFPLTLFLAGLIVILVIAAMIIVIRRHLNHRHQNQTAQLEMLQQKVTELEQEKLEKFD